MTRTKYYTVYLNHYICYLIHNNCVMNASFNKHETHCIPFPIEYDSEFRFVREYVYENENRCNTHIIVLKYGL